MSSHHIAAVAAALACLAAAGSAGGADVQRSTIKSQDSRAESNARNLTSLIESCFTDTEDYSQCRSAAVLNREQGMGEFHVPIGPHRGQARVSKATKLAYTIDAWSRSGNHFMVVKSSDERIARKCTRRGRGLCRKNGTW